DATVAGVHAGIQNARVALAMSLVALVIEYAYYFVEMNHRRGTRQPITTLDAALRLNQAGLIQDPHELARIRDRDAFQLRYLRQRQRLALGICARKLQQTTQPVFFLCGYLHSERTPAKPLPKTLNP